MESGGDGPLLRAGLIAGGYRDDEVRRMRRSQALVAVRPGAYLRASDDRLRKPAERHALMVRAALQQLGGKPVVSHISAAVLHGMAVWAVPLDRVHLSQYGRSGGRRSRYLHRHAAALDLDDIVLIDGIAVTSAARTVADLARTLPFEQAVVIADNALYRRLVRPEQLVVAVERAARRHGVAAAGRVLAFADGLAESPGESRSRVAMWRAGLPVPTLQANVWSADGRSLGRTDFDWPELGVVGEFDGLVKYGRLVPEGQVPGDVVVAEKRREDLIREQGKWFVRWMWDEIAPFDGVARRLRRAMGER